MKKLIKALIVISIVFTLAACGQTSSEDGSGGEKRTVKIGYLPITHAVPLYMGFAEGKRWGNGDAQQGGSFETFNLELVKFGSWPDLMDALATGKIDGASVLVTLAMRAKEQGIGLKAVALGHRDGNVIVTANDVESAKDLVGKSFAIPHKFSTHNILLYQMLKQQGIAYEDLNVIELPPAEMPAALAEGRIAGYVVAEPFGAQSVVLGNGKVLFQSEEIWKDSVDCALVLRDEFIQEENEIAQAFVTQYIKAGEKAELKDENTYEVTSSFLKVDKEVLDLSLKWISYDDLRLDEEYYEKLNEYLVEMKLLENPPTYEAFVDNSLIDKVE